MTRHYFFDLDDTLTPSRAPMRAEHVELFKRLCESADVIVVTGGAEEQIRKQIPLEAKGSYYMLTQQGNLAISKDGTELWREAVTPAQEAIVKPFARMLTDEFLAKTGAKLADENDIWENRGSQFASSVIGFHAPNEIKYAADPTQAIRRELLVNHTAEISRLHEIGIDVMPAGTTTYDFILRGKHKGFNITRLNSKLGWSVNDCLYFGDALFPGGNDETVIGVIPTHPVTSSDDTFSFIKEMLS